MLGFLLVYGDMIQGHFSYETRRHTYLIHAVLFKYIFLVKDVSEGSLHKWPRITHEQYEWHKCAKYEEKLHILL